MTLNIHTDLRKPDMTPSNPTLEPGHPDYRSHGLLSSPPQIPIPESLMEASATDLSPDISFFPDYRAAYATAGSPPATPGPVTPSDDLEAGCRPEPGFADERICGSGDAVRHELCEEKSPSYHQVHAQLPSLSPVSAEGTHSFPLPIPALSPNKAQLPLTFLDVVDDAAGLDALPPDIAGADIAVAPDGTFVETSSGPAARELKRRYDQQYGVNVSVRSPYAITAFVNQHGKQMYRIGPRDLSAPLASAANAEEFICQPKSSSETSPTHRPKRRSRKSMHAFLPPTMFNKTSGTSVRPQTVVTHSTGTRKLRKTRSIPDMTYLTGGTDGSTLQNQQGTVSAITGRAHSQSVTAADLPRFPTISTQYTPVQTNDIFGDVMEWSSVRALANISTISLFHPGNISGRSEHGSSRASIAYPFGPGVTFESPSGSSANDTLPLPPRLLREMQSFESGLTAKQPAHSMTPPDTLEAPYYDSTSSRPPSALRLRESMISMQPTEPPAPTLSPETAMISHYTTDAFDILQTYRGLPRLDKLAPGSEGTTVIKMSLSSDETAAPRDDPRFVIWGEIHPDRDVEDLATSRDSFTDASSIPSSSLSKRRSSKATKGKVPVVPSVAPTPQRALIAATIERWIAQLTSELNYDELLDFFLTYRTYVSAVDLCHLLICRFHWTLQQASTPKDETVKRIVRVRTFVAIRYWLLTFFIVDFLPNRELRLLFARWLNTLLRDPILKQYHDGLGIVRRLIKVAKDCKQAHSRSPAVPKPRAPSKPAAVNQDHVLGKKFAEATQKLNPEFEDSDLDLDFLPEERSVPDVQHTAFSNDSVNAHLSAAHVGAGLSPTRQTAMPLSSFMVLKQPSVNIDYESPFTQTPSMLPVHHGALSRAFVKTIGRLGRWKRVLNSRSQGRPSLGDCTNGSAFDLELSVSRDLLTVNGGVDQYLKMIESTGSSPSLTVRMSTPEPVTSSEAEAKEASVQVPPVVGQALTPPDSCDSVSANEEAALPSNSSDHAHAQVPVDPLCPLPASPAHANDQMSARCGQGLAVGIGEDRRLSGSAESFHSSSTDSFGAPIPDGDFARAFQPTAKSAWQVDVVSIDDLDLSDTSSDAHVRCPSAPPGLRKTERKLPLRRDFEFVKRPESVSSMGIISRESLGSGPSSSVASTASFAGLGGTIQQWQVNAIIDSLSNDGESGDVENALRRLEGQINPEKLQEKASKVDGWVRAIQDRMASGDYEDEEPRFPCDDDIDADVDGAQALQHYEIDESASTHAEAIPDLLSASPSDIPNAAHNPILTQTFHHVPPPHGLDTTGGSNSRPESVVPILQSRRLSSERTKSQIETSRFYRSFVLNYRAEVLAEHFSMIDRELFMGVKFEELVLDDWMRCHEVSIYDWNQYIRDRARWKAEGLFLEKTTALAAVRARFNVLTSFVMSEIALTPPNQRPEVVGKFVRIAWKAYELYNFNLLTAIITALQSEWVNKAMRRLAWNRIGVFESRAFRDLKQFTTAQDDFKFMRQAVDAIVDAKPINSSTHAPSIISPSSKGTETPSGKSKVGTETKAPLLPSCIPFIGIYLSQLYRLSMLPDLIDPTAPNAAVGIDPISANFDPPSHPEVFSALAPLPPSMHLEPLINIHKQRQIASVIKGLVAGQHLASRMKFEVDKRLFQKCLRLRGLDVAQRALAAFNE